MEIEGARILPNRLVTIDAVSAGALRQPAGKGRRMQPGDLLKRGRITGDSRASSLSIARQIREHSCSDSTERASRLCVTWCQYGWFVPVGFVFFLFCSSVRRVERLALAVVLQGSQLCHRSVAASSSHRRLGCDRPPNQHNRDCTWSAALPILVRTRPLDKSPEVCSSFFGRELQGRSI
jgi:hypothetical protein